MANEKRWAGEANQASGYDVPEFLRQPRTEDANLSSRLRLKEAVANMRRVEEKLETRRDAERWAYARKHGLIFADQSFVMPAVPKIGGFDQMHCTPGQVGDDYADAFIDERMAKEAEAKREADIAEKRKAVADAAARDEADRNRPLRESDNDIGWVVSVLRMGSRVRRRGWNGKGMFLILAKRSHAECPSNERLLVEPHVLIWAADGKVVPWLCSQSDLLARDWEIAQ